MSDTNAALLEALKLAVRQNEHDMLMTGEELRHCRAALAQAEAAPTAKAKRVHALVNAGPYPGMSEAFNAHMGAACWTDLAYRQDAATWAAAWKAALSAAEAAPKQGAAIPDLRERLAEAHDASLDDDGRACRAILTECMRLLDAAQPQQPAPEPVARVPLTEKQMLDCVRSVGTPAPMGLTRDRGPYEVTEPTWFLIQLVRSVERAHGIAAAPQAPTTGNDNTEGRA